MINKIYEVSVNLEKPTILGLGLVKVKRLESRLKLGVGKNSCTRRTLISIT